MMVAAPTGLSLSPIPVHPAESGTAAPDRAGVAHRLTREFGRLPADQIARCVADVSACVEHLGVAATATLVERIAREHLVGVVKSEPPSGRGASPETG